MVNLEKVKVGRQENAGTDSLELLGLLDDVEDEYLNTQCEHEAETPEFHCHSLKDSRCTRQNKTHAKRKLLITSVVCLIFMIGEVIGGYAAHSLAIMTDAAHLLTDFCSILISLFSLWISSRPPSKRLTFGWHRAGYSRDLQSMFLEIHRAAEFSSDLLQYTCLDVFVHPKDLDQLLQVLGALLSVLSVWAVTIILVLFAVQRIITGDYDIHSDVMLITAGCAVVMNILLALILHQSAVHHPHSHSAASSEEHSSTSVRAAFIHTVGDLLQSVGVLLAATLMYFRPEWKLADPVCTFLFSILVLGTTFTILKDISSVLMEGVPPHVDFNSVHELLLSVGGVKSTHDLHMWSLNTSETHFSVHVVIEEQTNPQTVLLDMTKQLQSKYGFSSITIQTETHTDSRTQD